MYHELHHYLTHRGYKFSVDDFYSAKNLIHIFKKNEVSVSFLKKENEVISIKFVNRKKEKIELTIDMAIENYNLDYFKKKLKKFKKI